MYHFQETNVSLSLKFIQGKKMTQMISGGSWFDIAVVLQLSIRYNIHAHCKYSGLLLFFFLYKIKESYRIVYDKYYKLIQIN